MSRFCGGLLGHASCSAPIRDKQSMTVEIETPSTFSSPIARWWRLALALALPFFVVESAEAAPSSSALLEPSFIANRGQFAETIDPTLLYSSYFGGSGFEDARAVATDSSGNVYLAGSTGLGLFPIRVGSQDAFVQRDSAQSAQSSPWAGLGPTVLLAGVLVIVVFVQSRKEQLGHTNVA